MAWKVFILYLIVFLFPGISISPVFSADEGPGEMLLTSSTSRKKEPSVFPHKKHQKALACGECHHTMIDGKQAPYSKNDKIQKCETCHNTEVLPGKKIGKFKLYTFKGAAHGNCLNCHKKIVRDDSSRKKLTRCKTCHQKSPGMITIRDGKKN